MEPNPKSHPPPATHTHTHQKKEEEKKKKKKKEHFIMTLKTFKIVTQTFLFHLLPFKTKIMACP